MAEQRMGIGQTLDRLSAALRCHAIEVSDSLRPGATDEELEELRQVVAPHELPADLVALLRWANGQEKQQVWWPVLESGPLLGAAEAAEHFKWLRSNAASFFRLLVPIAHDGWWQVGVEVVGNGSTAVIDCGFGDAPRVLAPTLIDMLDVTADMVEAGIAFPPDREDARIWRHRRDEITEARADWSRWPWDRVLDPTGTNWPPHWQQMLHHDSSLPG